MSLTRRPGIRPQKRTETLSGLGTRGGSGRLRQNPPRRMHARPTGGFFPLGRGRQIASAGMRIPANGRLNGLSHAPRVSWDGQSLLDGIAFSSARHGDDHGPVALASA